MRCWRHSSAIGTRCGHVQAAVSGALDSCACTAQLSQGKAGTHVTMAQQCELSCFATWMLQAAWAQTLPVCPCSFNDAASILQQLNLPSQHMLYLCCLWLTCLLFTCCLHAVCQAGFDMPKAWDGRCRKWYADRYDFRTNMVRMTRCCS